MKSKSLLLLIAFLVIFSCDKEDEKLTETPVSEDPVEEPAIEDETKPELTVVGLTGVVEKTSEISITIVDDSTVETKVMLGEEELASSTEKQFTFSLNPYGIAVGDTEFMIISEDANGNETSETYTVEIKHLLMNYEHLSITDSEADLRAVFFNNLNGTELGGIDPEVGENKIYTEELILDDKIYYTLVTKLNNINALFLNTYKIDVGGTRKPFTNSAPIEFNSTVEVTLNGIPFNDDRPAYLGEGSNYNTTSFSGDELKTTLMLEHEGAESIYIRNNRFGSSPKFNGKKENYEYFKFMPESGSSSLTVEANQLISAEENLRLDVPEHDMGSLAFSRKGYENDFFSYQTIFDMSSSNLTEMVDYIDLPIFSEFTNYSNELSYRKNDLTYSALGSDVNLDVTIPNWMATAALTDTTIEVTADNQDVDYYSVRMQKSVFTGGYKLLSWRFYISSENDMTEVTPRLAIPVFITDLMGGDSFFGTTNDLEINKLEAIDYAKYNSFEEVMNWFVFRENPLVGSENNTRKISFPESSYSGNSGKKQSQLNLKEFLGYDLEQIESIIDY